MARGSCVNYREVEQAVSIEQRGARPPRRHRRLEESLRNPGTVTLARDIK